MPSLKRNFDKQSFPHSGGFDIHRYIPDLSREKIGQLGKPLLLMLLLVGGYSISNAQEGVSTEVAPETTISMVIENPVTLRDDPERRSDNAILDENNAPIILQPGTEVLIGNITQNGGYRWGEVLQINSSPAPEGGVFIALDGNGYTFATPLEPEAEPGPEAPIVVTEAPTDAATEAASTEAPIGTEVPANVEQVIAQAEEAMRAIGVEDPHFSEPMQHDGLETRHLVNSTYYLGRFNTTNGDYLVSYCAPVAVATQAAYSGDAEQSLVVANGLVDEYQYSTSTAVMNALGSGDTASLEIGGVNYDITRWELSNEGIEDRINDLAIGGSTVVVFRNVEDASKIGHLVTIQRFGEDQYVITQSNTRDGMFFRDATETAAAQNIGAGNGGVFISIGNAENVSNFVNDIAAWYYATGIAGMVPQG